MLTIGTLNNAQNIRGFRFASVEIDIPTREVRVAGRVQNCPPKAFELLLMLCQAPATVIARAALLDALWPGGQVISDEALTQTVFRARNALGEHADLLNTVRGVGVRLNARVVAIEAQSAAPAKPRAAARVHSAEPTAPAVAARRQGWLPWSIVAGVAIALLAAFLIRSNGPPAGAEPVVVDKGYGLMAADVLASRAETVTMIVEALQNDSRGERERAKTLLEATHADDPTTPIPALFLALWAGAGGGDLARSDDWLDQAATRIGDTGDIYLKLLHQYVTAECRGTPKDVIRIAGTLLDIRPDAWRMHLARAHLLEYIGMREAALREISQVEVDSLSQRKIALTIADRASMGDVDGAQAILNRLGPDSDPLEHTFISGRVAWSRGDFDTAHRHFLDAANRAYELARLDIFRRSLIYAAAIDAANGRESAAVAGLERARSALEERSLIDDIDISLFLAQLHEAAGRHEKALAELGHALDQDTGNAPNNILTVAYLTAMRMQTAYPVQRPGFFDESADALWRASIKLREHDLGGAQSALNEARYHGVFQGRLADEARWLEFQLDEPVTAEKPLDPPYPPLARVMVRRELRSALAQSGIDPGATRP